jgi:hypothetical protein
MELTPKAIQDLLDDESVQSVAQTSVGNPSGNPVGTKKTWRALRFLLRPGKRSTSRAGWLRTRFARPLRIARTLSPISFTPSASTESSRIRFVDLFTGALGKKQKYDGVVVYGYEGALYVTEEVNHKTATDSERV